MSALKIFATAAAVLIGASSLVMAQTSGSVRHDSAASGGAGTHSSSVKTGGAANTQKIQKNQNGYR